jgi:hypothetical protein
MPLFTLAFVLILLLPTPPDAGQAPAPPASDPSSTKTPAADTDPVRRSVGDVLSRLRNRYRTATTYRDTGVSVSDLGSHVSELRFGTVFIRKGGFRWWFHPADQVAHTYQVWSEDRSAWMSWWGLDRRLRKDPDLSGAIAGPTGISSGVVQVIPVMLVEDPKDCSLLSGLRTQPHVARDTVEGVPCDVISGAWRERSVKIWVDDTGALRQYTESYDLDPGRMADAHPSDPSMQRARQVPKFHVEQRVNYRPVFDEPVKPEETRFTPPEL